MYTRKRIPRTALPTILDYRILRLVRLRRELIASSHFRIQTLDSASMPRRTFTSYQIDNRIGRAPSFVSKQTEWNHSGTNYEARSSISMGRAPSYIDQCVGQAPSYGIPRKRQRCDSTKDGRSAITSYPAPLSHPSHQTPSECALLCLQAVNPSARGYRLTNIHPGMIINSAMHEDDYRHTRVPEPENMSGVSTNLKTMASGETKILVDDITFSRYGPIHTKWRYMIVVALFCDHYLAVPCYSFGGHGTEKKADQQEYMPVSNYPVEGQETLITKSWTAYRALHPKTAAHVARPVARSYDVLGTHCGELDRRSVDHLIECFVQRMKDASLAWQRRLNTKEPISRQLDDY